MEKCDLDKQIEEAKNKLESLINLKRKIDVDDDQKILIDFGFNVKKIRELNHLSQEDFASITQISRGYVSKLENGKINPSYTSFLRIVTNLGLDENQITQLISDNVKEVLEQNKKNL